MHPPLCRHRRAVDVVFSTLSIIRARRRFPAVSSRQTTTPITEEVTRQSHYLNEWSYDKHVCQIRVMLFFGQTIDSSHTQWHPSRSLPLRRPVPLALLLGWAPTRSRRQERKNQPSIELPL